MCTFRKLSASLLSVLFTVLPLASAQRDTRRIITWCAEDGSAFGLHDAPDEILIATLQDIQITARYRIPDQDRATFTLTRAGTKIYEIAIDDLSNPNGWMPIASNRKSFAITWSNGGAAGGWTTQIFRRTSSDSVVEDKIIMAKVEHDFSSRHHCPARGENYQAIRWMDDEHLLVAASVYGSGDCGLEAAYTEGYLVKLSSDTIERRMTEHELLNLPSVCTWNVYRPSPPSRSPR